MTTTWRLKAARGHGWIEHVWAREGDRARWIGLVVTAVGVGGAAARMALIARESSTTQYADYWPMLDTILSNDGEVRWRGVLEARNQHPIAIPKLLYLLNVGLTNGNNHGQAVIVIVIALGLVGLIALLVRGTPGMGRPARVMMVVTTAVAVFSPLGTWSYVKAMSGTAWLTANLFVVAALLAQQHGRRWLTPALGVLACISYGTGLAVWPALIIAGGLRDGTRWRAHWPVWATGAVVSALYLRWYVDRYAGPQERAGPLGTVKGAVRLVVGAFADGASGAVLAALFAGLVAATLWVSRDRLADTAPWVGLMTFGGVAALLIGRTRVDQLTDSDRLVAAFGDGLPSRYWTIVAWAWIGLAGLAVVALRDRKWRAIVPVVLLVASWRGGSAIPASLHGPHETQDLVAVGMRIGLADGNFIGGGGRFPVITAEARAAGHQPFDGSFSMGCGLLGERVDVEPTLPHGYRGSVQRVPGESTGVIHLRGAVTTPDGHLECTVIVDAEGTVVGTGPVHTWGHPHRVGIRAIAPTQYFLRMAVRIEPDGPLYVVPTKRP